MYEAKQIKNDLGHYVYLVSYDRTSINFQVFGGNGYASQCSMPIEKAREIRNELDRIIRTAKLEELGIGQYRWKCIGCHKTSKKQFVDRWAADRSFNSHKGHCSDGWNGYDLIEA